METDIEEMPLGWPGGPKIQVGDKLYSSEYDHPFTMVVKRLYLENSGSYSVHMTRKDGSGGRHSSGSELHTTIESWKQGRINRLQNEQQRIQREIVSRKVAFIPTHKGMGFSAPKNYKLVSLGNDCLPHSPKKVLYIINDGETFYGTLEEFRDCFFWNATHEFIIDWCKEKNIKVTFDISADNFTEPA